MNAKEIKAILYGKILPLVTKPVRYIGGERNAVIKERSNIPVKVLLAFPEVYEIGMSFLGFKILYEIINSRVDSLAERAFSPWVDMEKEMREKNIPLYSLETFTPAKEFDIIGITLQYEMTFTNILQLLSLAGIPFLSKERQDSFPLIIGGGPSAYGPEPLADIFDAFVIGDGEEIIKEIIDAVKSAKEKKLKKQELLIKLSSISGVYIPSLSGAGKTIKRRILPDFENAKYPVKPVIPFMNVIQDRITLEIMRGCSRGCRFCVSGFTSRPIRERSEDMLLSLAKQAYNNTGCEEMSLSSLSSTDHSSINEIAERLSAEFDGKEVSLSIPSSRIDAFSIGLAGKLSSVRKSTLTFAVEAATQRLRNVINKATTEEDLMSACESAFKSGWASVKLYFMLGLPTETMEDVREIPELIKRVGLLGRKYGPRFKGVTASIAFFVPKPHTPFQWEAQDDHDILKKKIDAVRHGVNPKWIKWHSLELSLLEAVFARGDRKLSAVLIKAFEKGCRFDGWSEIFNFNLWQESFRECGIDPAFYANRKREYDEVLPWDNIDIGVTKDFFINESEKAKKGEITENCSTGSCNACGLEKECDNVTNVKNVAHVTNVQKIKDKDNKTSVRKYRVVYEKSEDLKFLSHLDLIGTIKRALGRTLLPVAFSEGFNPQVKLTFSPALPVGVSSIAEVFDFELYRPEKDVETRIKSEFPKGINVISVSEIPMVMKLKAEFAVYEIDYSGKLTGEKPASVADIRTEGNKLIISVDLRAPSATNIYRIIGFITNLPENDVKILQVKRIKIY